MRSLICSTIKHIYAQAICIQSTVFDWARNYFGDLATRLSGHFVDKDSASEVPTSTQQDCLYNTLGVSSKATLSEIRAGYKKMSLKYHPDKNGGNLDALAKSKRINEAWEVCCICSILSLYFEKWVVMHIELNLRRREFGRFCRILIVGGYMTRRLPVASPSHGKAPVRCAATMVAESLRT